MVAGISNPLTLDRALDPGTQLGPYEIKEPLGAGGMGEVYRARDRRLGRDVAVKLVRADRLERATDRGASDDPVEALLREARTAASLNHRHVCTVYEVGEEEGQPYIGMEYVEGKTLRASIPDGGLPSETVIRVGIQIAAALSHAHGRGVVHRDLKPANVKLPPSGEAKVLDFGLALRVGGEDLEQIRTSRASLAETLEDGGFGGGIVGTLPYMAPETLRGEGAGETGDLWALGVVLYEAATGKLPFEGQTGFELTSAILKDPCPALPEGVPAGLAAVIRRCLSKEPARRYQSAGEMHSALEAVESSRTPVAATRGSRAEHLPPRGELQAPISALVVLPLQNLSADPDQEYFADGMTEELITHLAKVRALRVISRTSAMRYKATDKPMPEIAGELDVDAVVEGSVLRAGQRVRITAQLVHGATDTHLWAESYERDLEDVLLLQSDVAQAIAREIEIAITPEDATRLASAHRVDPEAYDAFLKGRFHAYKLAAEQFETALDYFELATERDPGYALPHTGIAFIWLARGVWGFTPPREAFGKCHQAVLKALELEDGLAEGHDLLARYLQYCEWDWSAAEAEFQRALALDPSSADTHLFYGNFLKSMLRMEESSAEFERALELDPLNFYAHSFLGTQFLYERRYEDAIAKFRKILSSEPQFPQAHHGLWVAFHQNGMQERALTEAERFFTALGDRQIAEALAERHAEAGYAAAMSVAAAKLAARADLSYVPPMRLARLYAHAGEEDRALDWLERAYRERDPSMAHLQVALDWGFDVLSDEPRFQALLRRMDFPDTPAQRGR